MILENIENNKNLVQRLSSSIIHQNISHAYIFEGDGCVDKRLVADCFIKAILCEEAVGFGCDMCATCRKIDHGNHEDVIYVEADENSVKDAFIEELQARLKKKPYVGTRNIAVIQDADSMTDRAQNRLLKTLEEPPVGTVIILLSENTENLKQTILSRCVVYRVNPFGTEGYLEMMQEAQKVADMFLDSQPFYAVKGELEEIIGDKDQTYKFLDALEHVYRDLIVVPSNKSKLYRKDTIFEAVSSIEAARRDLQRGMSAGYALKNLILEIGG